MENKKHIGIIELEDMEFYAGHGCYSLEQIVGNRFRVNLSIEADLTVPMQSDDVTTTVNYLSVYEMVEQEMKTTSHILEYVASRILDRLLREFSAVESATIKISKMSPPLGGKVDRVSVTIKKSRDSENC